jgi:dolichol-phosphate mannosyltransferase
VIAAFWAVLAGILALQGGLALRVVARLLRTRGGTQIVPSDAPSAARVSVVVPVVNERARLGACLEGLIAQPAEVREILVVDGGSSDGTVELVVSFAARDARVRVIDASPVPADWIGKAWGLENGLRASRDDSDVVLCIDADVRVSPLLVRSLLAHEPLAGVPALSVATRQVIAGAAQGLLHPSMLATLVYRFGSPGGATADAAQVQANGQCFMARRNVLLRSGAFRAARASLCEDITVARCLAASGHAVGFYEAGALVEAAMYADWRDAWRNWPRSLPMRDQYGGWRNALGLAEVALVQALPLPLLLIAWLAGAPWWALALPAALVAMRIGVLAGMVRAYVAPPWTYWLSPLADTAVAAAMLRSALRRRHGWRGRMYERAGTGRFRLASRRST